MRATTAEPPPPFPIDTAPGSLLRRGADLFTEGLSTASALLSSCLGSAGLRSHAHTLSGAAFAAGWWVFADAVLTQPRAPGAPLPPVPPLRWVPGALATAAAALMASVAASHDGGYEVGAGAAGPGASAALFGAFLCSFFAIIGSAGAAVLQSGAWLGVAGVLQCVLLLAAGLAAFVASDGESGGGGWGSYAAF